jgi:hypothetical protein
LRKGEGVWQRRGGDTSLRTMEYVVGFFL